MSNCRAFACANKGCQNTIHLHHDIETKLRRTHETFYCPAGHSNYFPGKKDEQNKIEGLERRIVRFRELWEETLEQRDEWKLLAKSCPFECGYRVLRKSKPENIAATLAMHLIEEHGATLPLAEPVVGAPEEGQA